MPVAAGHLRYPKVRALLPRTRLAYVHLQNLLTDAKRDRAARVFGYVAIWLPEEFLVLYMEEGDVVNATATADGRRWRALPISEALAMVPSAAEYGEICFHEAEDEQLAAMFATQLSPDLGWPAELPIGSSSAMLGNLMATLFDGLLEVTVDGGVNYIVFQHGMPLRGYYADDTVVHDQSRVRTLLDQALRNGGSARRWGVPPVLPNQAAPALIVAYRDLVSTLVRRLHESGAESAFVVAEHARHHLIAQHPALERFSLSIPNQRDPVVDAQSLSAAIAAWLGETLWHLHLPEGITAERLLADVARSRRHLFQAAGLFDALPWTIPW
ncbi:MAG: hypothetical protein H3C62_05985 [Gemmatimonadaceae bacterium]|nr:hypothetical protein [Gemmatimonadaceae bacterium]